MDQFNLAEKLCNLENYITTFAIAQGLAFSVAVAKREIKLLKTVLDHGVAYFAALVCTGCYFAAIVLCEEAGTKHLVDRDQQHIWYHSGARADRCCSCLPGAYATWP